MRVGINGMGRIGRLALRAAMGAAERQVSDPRAGNRLDIVHLNELKGGAATCAHLLEFDSVQGRWRGDIVAGEDELRIDGRQMSFSDHAAPGDIPWGDLGVDLVLECTGKFVTTATVEAHLARGAKRVISPRRSRTRARVTSSTASTTSCTIRPSTASSLPRRARPTA